MDASSVQHDGSISGDGGNPETVTTFGGPGRREGRVLRWRKPLLAIVAALVTAAVQRAVYSAGKPCPTASAAAPAYLPIQTGALYRKSTFNFG